MLGMYDIEVGDMLCDCSQKNLVFIRLFLGWYTRTYTKEYLLNYFCSADDKDRPLEELFNERKPLLFLMTYNIAVIGVDSSYNFYNKNLERDYMMNQLEDFKNGNYNKDRLNRFYFNDLRIKARNRIFSKEEIDTFLMKLKLQGDISAKFVFYSTQEVKELLIEGYNNL